MRKVSLIKNEPKTIYIDNCVIDRVYAYNDCGTIRTLQYSFDGTQEFYSCFAALDCNHFPAEDFPSSIEEACKAGCEVFCFPDEVEYRQWITDNS